MARIVFIRLPDGSLTEAHLKIQLSKRFGGSTEHRFCIATCRMRLSLSDGIHDDLVSIFTEINDPSSKIFMDFMQGHYLLVPRHRIIGILHPNEWSSKCGESLTNDLKIITEISKEYGIPMLPLSEKRRRILGLGGA